jgi:flagellar basal-body rod modification protein FlgD
MQTNLFNNPAASTAAGAGVAAQSSDASANADMFTKLLVAQIRNQDPLSPTDPSQFVNQLSQLSQTEALQKLATSSNTNAAMLQSLQVLGLGAQVGSQVMVETPTVALDGAKVGGQLTLPAASSATSLVLTGADGKAHKISLGKQDVAGAVPFELDPAALGLANGSYTLSVETVPPQTGVPVDIAGTLTSVRLDGAGVVVLKVAHVGEVDPAAVTAFNGTSAARSAGL